MSCICVYWVCVWGGGGGGGGVCTWLEEDTWQIFLDDALHIFSKSRSLNSDCIHDKCKSTCNMLTFTSVYSNELHY